MAVFDDIQTILTASVYYDRAGSAEMDQRETTLNTIRAALETWLPDEFRVADEVAPLQAGIGGRHGGVSPVPWVRVFSPPFSPKPTEGFYLVYLFAGDGSRVYLSLNQGTSEFRSNAMRPIQNPAVVTARAAAARQLFDTWSPELLEGMTPDIDLAAEGLTVGSESKQRIRNYEQANVYALTYEADQQVSDDQLRSDLRRMLALLQRVYFDAATPGDVVGAGSTLVAPKGQFGQIRVADSRVRKAVEDYSMAVVMWLYAETGEWHVTDVSRYRSYDVHLERKSDSHEVHVEVKGTASKGDKIFLTNNEVDLAREFPHTVLVILRDIALDYRGNEIHCHGGQLRVFNNWVPADEALTPVQFTYQVPNGVPSK